MNGPEEGAESLSRPPCKRCGGSAIDPEYSYPAEGPSYYSMGEPEHLEPCINCQFPRPEEVDRYRLAWLSARRRAARESQFAAEAMALKDAEIARLAVDVTRAEAFVADVQKIRGRTICDGNEIDHLRDVYAGLHELEDADREGRPYRDATTRRCGA